MGNEDCNSTIHGTGSPYFLKIMLADFAQKLRIPPLFVPRLIKENSENMILQGPGARQWTVKLWGNSTRLEFRQGWKFFVQDHTVEAGDILVFKYISESYFKVRIFGRNGCEKNIINFGKSDKRCGDTSPASQLPVALDCEEEMNGDHTEAAAQKGKKLKSFSDDHLPKDPKHFQPSFAENEHDTRKSAKAEQTSCGKLKLHYVSGRRPATEIERNKALEAANTFTSDKPFCLIVLKPSHLYKGHWLNFPRGYEDRLKLPKERREVVLLDPNSNEWHVQYVWSSRNIGALSSGWKSFSLVNNLEVGDICIFERADEGKINIKLRVHIFRVAMKYGPHKRVEGRGMDDCLPLPLNHSNKKMKVGREDLPINLTAKSSDPEEGKIAKQVQEKKEKASTYLKMDKSKCTLSPWERKTACRSSLRLAMKCNPVKSSKKELLSLCPSSSEEGQKAIGRDTMVPDPDVSVKEEVLMNISESNDEPHAMPPRSGQLHPSQGPLPEVPLMTNSMCFQMNLEGEASSLGVALSPEEAIFVVDISSSDTEN